MKGVKQALIHVFGDHEKGLVWLGAKKYIDRQRQKSWMDEWIMNGWMDGWRDNKLGGQMPWFWVRWLPGADTEQ